MDNRPSLVTPANEVGCLDWHDILLTPRGPIPLQAINQLALQYSYLGG